MLNSAERPPFPEPRAHPKFAALGLAKPRRAEMGPCRRWNPTMLRCSRCAASPGAFLAAAASKTSSLTAPAGTITGFIGVNGAGKSTTLRCVLGLIRPDAGEIRLFGAPASPAAAPPGRVPPRGARPLPARAGARGDRLPRPAEGHGPPRRPPRRRRRCSSALALAAASARGSRRSPRATPSGSRSSAPWPIARACCSSTNPSSGLDPVAQAEVLSLFAEFRSQGGAIVFSTHSMAAAESLCDRVVMLAAGRTVFEGDLRPTLRSPGAAWRGGGHLRRGGLLAAAAAVGGRAHRLPAASARPAAGEWFCRARSPTRPCCGRWPSTRCRSSPSSRSRPTSKALSGIWRRRSGLTMPPVRLAAPRPERGPGYRVR